MGTDKKKPRYKNVNIPLDLWEIAVFVSAVRGLNTADYLGPILRDQLWADWQAEVARMQKDHQPPGDPPRKRKGGE